MAETERVRTGRRSEFSIEILDKNRHFTCHESASNSFSFCLAGWINREQQAVIDYLQEEIRMLKESSW